MGKGTVSTGREILDGTLNLGFYQVVILGSGFIIAATLTRWLGPHGYGQYSLAVNFVLVVEVAVATLLFPAVQQIAAAENPMPLASSLLRLFLGAGLLGWLLLSGGAGWLADGFDEPLLRTLLPMLAVEIPLFAWTQAHAGVLMGLGRYRHRAVLGIIRWCARAVFVVALVGSGFGVRGAIVGLVSSTLLEAVLCRRILTLRVFNTPTVPIRRLLASTGALAGAALVIRFLVGLDIFMLKGLGFDSSAIGLYASAQTLSTMPVILLAGSVQAVLAALSRAYSGGRIDEARQAARTVLRIPFWLLPFGAAAAGSAGAVMALVFGEPYRDAGSVLRLLLLASIATVGFYFGNSVVAGAGAPRRVLRDMGVALTVAVPAHVVLIPRLGPMGAATATTAACLVGWAAALVSVRRMLRVRPGFGTVARCLLVAAAAGTLSAVWPTDGLSVVVEMAVIAATAVVLLVVVGEIDHDDRSALRVLVTRRPPVPAAAAAGTDGPRS